MERSFANEIESPKLGHGESILAVTEAPLPSSVSCAGGCRGVPTAAVVDERHSVLDTALRGKGASGGVPVPFTPLKREPARVH